MLYNEIQKSLKGLILACIFAPALAYANIYSVNFLSSPGAIASNATSISNSGLIAGSVLLNNWNGPAYSGAIWNSAGDVRVGVGLDPLGVNSSGTLTGSAKFGFYSRAATSSEVDFSFLDFLGTGYESRGNAINEKGQVAGYSTILPGSTPHAVRWDGSNATDLGTLGGAFSYAYGISETGAVVGASRPYSNACCDDHATLWNFDGTIVDLGVLLAGSGDSVARGVNDQSDAVGYARYGLDNYHAVLWREGSAFELGTLPGYLASAAFDINNDGQIVGYSFLGGSSRATMWEDGVATNLNSFLTADQLAAGWTLESALSINDHGWIVGNAINRTLHTESSYVLRVSEIPEPSSSWLLLVGLSAFVATRARRAIGQRIWL